MLEDMSIGELVSEGVAYLADLVARIVNKIKGLAPIALVLGCESASVEPPAPPPAPAIVVPAPERDDGPRRLGDFTITFYYMIGEDEIASRPAPRPANDNELAAVAPDSVTLYEPDHCDAIADVSADFAYQLALQGSGKLRDGRVLNIWSRCTCDHTPCFKVTPNQWGNAGTGRPLEPFRTVAVDPKVVPLGSLLYVPLLEGRTMPGRPPWGGYVHDGCVVADDTGGFGGNKLDLFVGRKGYFLGLSGSEGSHAWARHVPVFDGSKLCEQKGRQIGRKSGAI
jgi:3D (Asp-Asp-Asp) domain-containing protein